jgi:hypothetical protein
MTNYINTILFIQTLFRYNYYNRERKRLTKARMGFLGTHDPIFYKEPNYIAIKFMMKLLK